MRNERLIANAGSGKTYALTTRMIQLLAHDVEPRKIAALTFTRKSAGEFLSAVFERLASAALDPEKLAKLKENEELKNLDAAQCRSMLVKLVSQLGCLGMGTIDSLFARIARAFPLESGLAEDFSMAGEAEIKTARERTLATLFANESSSSLRDFIDLLRRINRNQGERDVFETLLRETETLHGKFLATPEWLAWGDASMIWEKQGCAILKAGLVSPAADVFLQAVLETHVDFSDEAQNKLQFHLDLLRTLDSGGRWNQEISKFVKARLCAENTSGYFQITKTKDGRLYLNERVRVARLELLRASLKPEFESLLQRSQSLYEFMAKFEATYTSLVREAGLVTFGDITDSLARKAGNEIWRTTAGYRIDQKFEHWLLDEFQDTSRPQWIVLKTFIDEVIMDSGGQRSFFYVGDTKQAIYSWRGGDPSLFFEIFDEFNKHQSIIQEAPSLVHSWRSCADIVDFVNKVFGNLSSVKDTLQIPDVTFQKWQKAWSDHITSEKTKKVKGYAEWVSVKKDDGDEDDDGDALDRKVLEILQQTKPWERGLSCAVLKRDNTGVEALAALLQSVDIPVAVEGKTNPCVDNPLGAALIAALRVVASPDDALSFAVAQGFPVAAAWGLDDAWKFRSQTLVSLAQNGFATTIRAWIESPDISAEPFLKERADSFLLAAEEFDSRRKPADGILDFLRFVENRNTQEAEASDVVRVMTIHQSKGLGFDMAIVSGLDRRGRNNDGTQIALGPSPQSVQWGVLLPPKDFAEQDDVLRNQVEINEAERKYGDICTAYVALTRAKIALYVLTNELGENTTSKNFARHLGLQFGSSSAQIGNQNWFEDHAIKKSNVAVARPPVAFCSPTLGTPKPLSPSSFKTQSSAEAGGETFSFDAAKLGIEIHEALASIEWMDTSRFDAKNLSDEAAKLIRSFLAKPTAMEIFNRPEGCFELWREKAFDLILDDQWVSGIFDRVVIHYSIDGKPRSATVYDFKSDHGSLAEIEERYAGQMATYRKAISALLAMDSEGVTSKIVRLRS
jgi:superfamily I DNA/RNA helicase